MSADPRTCPNHRLHVIAVLSSAIAKIASDTAAEMIEAGFTGSEDDLEPFRAWVLSWVSEAVDRGWWGE